MQPLRPRLAVFLCAAAISWLFSPFTTAAPIVTVYVLGQVNGSGNPYSSSITVQNGSTVNYELFAMLANVGTTNTTGPTTITSLTPGTDGINALKFNLFQSASAPIQLNIAVPTLTNGFTNGTGASGGTLTTRSGSNNDVIDIRPIQASGVFVGVATANTPSAVEVGSGSATVSSIGSGGVSSLQLSYLLPQTINSSQTASGKINGGSPFVGSTTDTDPVVGFTSLTMSTPEPGSLWPIALVSVSLMLRRCRVAN